MSRLRRLLGVLALVVFAVEVLLFLSGVVHFGTAVGVVLAVEMSIALIVVVDIARVVRATRTSHGAEAELPVVLDDALGQFLPAPVARYVRKELMLMRAIGMLLTGRRDLREGEVPLAYGGPLVILLALVGVLDGLAAFLLHLLLPDSVRMVALVLGILGFVWLVGFLASLICYPHVVGHGRLRLRFSVFHDVTLPLNAVSEVRRYPSEPPSNDAARVIDGELVMAVSGQANLALALADATQPVSSSPRLRRDGPITGVVCYVDDPAAARRVLSTST
ncbi:hypothetical protein [Nocardioides sp. GXZ039]|uniref:hypothetical protein n=1 Tax=Nocardioides sp. GXZ039 TaxID=3136018 RepID=UPI0030F39442